MDVKEFMNSPMMWIMSSFMIINIFVMAAAFMRQAFKAAEEMGMEKAECIAGLRSSMITAIGPSFAPVIVLIALMATIGGPTAWMRMNDIGAARTELAMAQISANMAGSSIEGNALSLAGFVFILWGAALNNSGWIIIGGYGAPFLDKAVIYLKENFNATWIKLLMAAASFGLFATLLSNSIIKKTISLNNLYAALISFVVMLIIGKAFAKYKRLQEFSLGIAMLVGMFIAAFFF